MLDTIRHIDQQFFIAINNGLQNPFLDWLCPLLRKQSNWYLLYAVLLYLVYRKYHKQTVWIILGATVLILVSDQLSANLIKHAFERLRPCHDPILKDQVHLLVNCGSGYSFVSSHATNHFAIALFISMFFKTYRWFLPAALCWALCIAFSQVYVGVHYPADVICGGLLGGLLGYLAAKIVHFKLPQQA